MQLRRIQVHCLRADNKEQGCIHHIVRILLLIYRLIHLFHRQVRHCLNPPRLISLTRFFCFDIVIEKTKIHTGLTIRDSSAYSQDGLTGVIPDLPGCLKKGKEGWGGGKLVEEVACVYTCKGDSIDYSTWLLDGCGKRVSHIAFDLSPQENG